MVKFKSSQRRSDNKTLQHSRFVCENKKEQANDCISTIRIHNECNDTITTNATGDDNDCTPTIRMHNKHHQKIKYTSNDRTTNTTNEVVDTTMERPWNNKCTNKRTTSTMSGDRTTNATDKK